MSHASVLVVLDSSVDDIEDAVAEQMAPFDENGEWFGDGSRWDWWQIGGRFSGRFNEGKDVIKKKELNLDKMKEHKIAQARKWWKESLEAPPAFRGFIFSVEDGDTEESYVERLSSVPFHAYAFLKNKQWHEKGRMGWFGTTAMTECEVRGENPHICKFALPDGSGAQVVSWGKENWAEKFWTRFIEPLSDDAILVMVDYHV